MRTEIITFKKNNVNFEVSVTHVHHRIMPRLWEATIIEPKGMLPIKSDTAGKFFSIENRDIKYEIKKKAQLVNGSREKYFHSDIVDEVIYRYFNREKIEKYSLIVKHLKEKIDTDYSVQLDVLLLKKKNAKKAYKNKAIIESDYLKVIKEIKDLKKEIFNQKLKIDEEYYDNNRLKQKYRVEK